MSRRYNIKIKEHFFEREAQRDIHSASMHGSTLMFFVRRGSHLDTIQRYGTALELGVPRPMLPSSRSGCDAD